MKIQTHLHSNKSTESDLDLLQMVSTIWKGKWIVLFLTAIFFVLAFIYASGKVSIYEADALLQVEAKKAAIPGIEELAGLTQDSTAVGTELEIIKSRKTLGKAVSDLKLDISAEPKRVPILSIFYSKYFNVNKINKLPKVWDRFDKFFHKYAWGSEKINVVSLTVPDYLLNKTLTLISQGNSKFTILYKEKLLLEGEVGRSSSSIDKKLMVFVSELSAMPGTEFYVEKQSKLEVTQSLRRAINVSEKGKKTGIIKLTLHGKNKKKIVGILNHISRSYLEQNKSRSSEEATSALKFLKEQIRPVKALVDQAEGSLSKYRTDNQTADLSRETQAVLDVVSSIDTELQTLSLKREELAQRYTNNHPTIQAIFSQEKKLEKRKKASLSQVVKLPVKQQKLLKLERDFKVANTIYSDILNNIQEFKIAEASTVGNVYIIDTAIVYHSPVKPKKSLIIVAGTILGMIFGIALVFLRKLLHRTVDNPEILEEVTGIPVYATVPLTDATKQAGRFNSKNKRMNLLASEDMTDPAIESLRSLRTSLHFALLESKNNIVMVTGPSPGIGKSFITSNFAAVTAASEQRILLIDADMRKGYIHNLVNKKVSPGLSDLISNKSTLKEVIHTVKVGNATMDVITRGKTPPNPSELLMHSNFEKLLTLVSDRYDLVLIDTPPIHAVTDPTIIGKHAGVVFMVVRSDQHHIKEIEHAVKRLAYTNIPVKGFIFNGYVAKNSGYGYDYGYAYYGDYKVKE